MAKDTQPVWERINGKLQLVQVKTKKKNHRFKHKTDGYKIAGKSWMCTSCRTIYHQKGVKECKECGHRDIQYFMSEKERNRASELILLEQSGRISQLKFQPRYDLKVDGIKVTTYVADASYVIDGKQVVEDTKPPNKFLDPVSKIKINLFNAIYSKHGIQLTLIR